jgi:hypothetical protein
MNIFEDDLLNYAVMSMANTSMTLRFKFQLLPREEGF